MTKPLVATDPTEAAPVAGAEVAAKVAAAAAKEAMPNEADVANPAGRAAAHQWFLWTPFRRKREKLN